MRYEPGFVKELRREIESLDQKYRSRLARPGSLTENQLISLVSGGLDHMVVNVDHASESDVIQYDKLHEWKPGVDAVKAGEVAFVVLAGGNGTRVGGPKAFMRLPKLGISLIANKLVQSGFATHEGEVLQAHTWVMTSPDLCNVMAEHLCGLSASGIVFEQFESYRLSVDNRMSFVERGVPEMYPTGHGDVGLALIESGVLNDNPNVKYCVIVNCDNVLASLDPIMLSHHIKSGVDLTCEVIKRVPEDKSHGGSLVWADGRLQIVERFRIPQDFLRYNEPIYHNTNSMIINVSALKSEIDWKWHRVRKQVGTRLVVQYERLLQQYTENLNSQYVVVDRQRRYCPIKTNDDLEKADEVLNGNRLR